MRFKHKVAVARFVLADDAPANDDVTQRATEQAKQLIETQLGQPAFHGA